MNKANPNNMAKTLCIFLLSTALIVAGCADQGSVVDVSDKDGTLPPKPSGTASRTDSGIEEIIVTSNRSHRSRSANEQRELARGEQPNTILSNSAAGFGSGEYMMAENEETRPATSVQPGEELWIITKTTESRLVIQGDDLSPGSGAMVAHFPIDDQSDPREVPLPLKHTAVDATIHGYISTVNVTQKFENPFNEKIEAVYMFPLPEKAAITEFVMKIGDRRIRGILREKEEAEAVYNAARAQGYQASLLVQHRPNIFEQKVANIEPGKSIDVDIKYFHTLKFNDGWYSFVFPTVVGPRYNPPGHSDPIVPKKRGSGSDVDQSTTVEYLRPGERSAHDISINVKVAAGVEIEELKSTHEIVANKTTPESAEVSLAKVATIPNRDFILDFRVTGEKIKSNLLTYEDPQTNEGYFTLMLYPPENLTSLERQAMEMVFVLDISGSMSGAPLTQAKSAVYSALDHLQENDTFQIIRFSDNASQFGSQPLPATPANIRKARQYLQRLHSTGGTQMIEGVKAALNFPHDPARLRFVSFMTDGYIGNEADIIGAVHDNLGDARIFSFGVGSSVNRYLMERMAAVGRGAVAYLGPNDSGREIMADFFNRISHPALTNIEIDWGGMAVTDTYPAQLPDMFVGRSMVVTGKYLGAASDITINGVTANHQQQIKIAANYADAANSYLAKIWARLRIADLADRQTWQDDPHGELEVAIRNTALNYQLMSDYTSFVAVDSSQTTDGDHGTTVNQAVPVPDGVRYETTVNGN